MTDVLIGQPIPGHQVRPPTLPPSIVSRPRIGALLDDAVGATPVTVVCAPAGFGKTSAVADWVRTRPETVVWFTGGRTGLTPGRLLAGLAAAATHAGLPGFGDVLGAVAAGGSPDGASTAVVRSAVDLMLARLRAVPGPVLVVVDDVHGLELGPHSGVVRLLTELPDQLAVVLIGRDDIAAHLPREVVYGAVSLLGGDELAMTSEEIATLGTGPGAAVEPDAVLARTGGWPLAVRAAVLGGPGSERRARLLPDVVREEVLERVSPGLAELMLATTVARQLDADLASELCGYPAQDLLEECVAQGLFLRRVEDAGRPAVYVWLEAFAEACEQLAMRQDLARVRAARLAVARHLAATRPLEAIGYALDAGEPGYLGEHWPEIVASAEADRLHRTVARMIGEGAQEPFIRHVGVIALALDGERRGAQLMRGAAPAPGDGARDRLAAAFSAALSGVDTRERHAACEDAREAIGGATGLSPASHASALLLLGWVETRLRREPELPVEALRSAQLAARSLGLTGLERRAHIELAAALTIAGRQRDAAELAASMLPVAAAGSTALDDGGVPDFVRGHVAFWRGDHAESVERFRALTARDDAVTIAGAIGRVYAVFAACAAGNRAWIDEAERALRQVEGHDVLGLPMTGFIAGARAAVAESRENARAVAMHTRTVADIAHMPVMHALMAEIHRRAGRLDEASRLVERVPYAISPVHVKAIVLVTQALHARADRKFGVAHRLLESALDLAVPHDVVRPFDPSREPALRDLLDEHARWGGHHEALLVTLLNDVADETYRLSDREREILAYLRTSLTVAEIAERLFISVNTVKTHQRSLYRKLGVTTRREAIHVRV